MSSDELSLQLADLRALLLAPRPTGAIEIRVATDGPVPPGTEVLDGRTVPREMHPNLWRWALEHGLVRAGLFGVGDGTTTFTLPDFRAQAAGTPVTWLIYT